MRANNASITTEADYYAALARIYDIFDAKPGTPEGDELSALLDAVEAYEEAILGDRSKTT